VAVGDAHDIGSGRRRTAGTATFPKRSSGQKESGRSSPSPGHARSDLADQRRLRWNRGRPITGAGFRLTAASREQRSHHRATLTSTLPDAGIARNLAATLTQHAIWCYVVKRSSSQLLSGQLFGRSCVRWM
jgi:hypothetical protein